MKRILPLGLVALIALVGGCGESERAAPPEIYYLHIYSTFYDIHRPIRPNAGSERHLVGIATIGISPGVPFHAALPHYYEPTMLFEGMVTGSDDRLVGEFQLGLTGVDIALLEVQDGPLAIETLHGLGGGDPDFQFAISRQSDPDTLLKD